MREADVNGLPVMATERLRRSSSAGTEMPVAAGALMTCRGPWVVSAANRDMEVLVYPRGEVASTSLVIPVPSATQLPRSVSNDCRAFRAQGHYMGTLITEPGCSNISRGAVTRASYRSGGLSQRS